MLRVLSKTAIIEGSKFILMLQLTGHFGVPTTEIVSCFSSIGSGYGYCNTSRRDCKVEEDD